jgi:predicted molibdopterin-dependent oxidoreductase YjgC
VEAALSNAEFVVCLDTLPNATNQRAHVVLPAAGAAEKSGTTTNLEGRVTRVAAKTSAPGLARPDWMIAALLAHELGADLGFAQVGDVTAEIAAVAPSHLGLTAAVLDAAGNADGVLLPLPAAPVEEAEAPVAEAAEGEEPEEPVVSVPSLVSFRAPTAHAVVPTPDSYSLRLVTTRTLYDHGVLVQASPSLARLAPISGVHLNPGEVERHGLRNGGSVRVLSQSADLITMVLADERVPRGVAVLQVAGSDAGPAALVDLATEASEGITKVRLETEGS